MGTSIIAGHNNRKIRLISHSVEHCHNHEPTFFCFTNKKLCQSSTRSACQSDLFNFFVLHSKTNILYLCPQALFKMKSAASNNGVWKDFIYWTDDRCFKIDLYDFWWPERTPISQQLTNNNICLRFIRYKCKHSRIYELQLRCAANSCKFLNCSLGRRNSASK